MRDRSKQMRARVAVWTAACAAAAGLALAQHPAWAEGDPEAGHRLEQRWCSNCHAADDSTSATDAAPSFRSLARTSGQDPNWVRAWLTSSHPPMPNFNLSRAEIDDLVAYLSKLSQPQ